MSTDPRLVAMARRILDDNLYMTLGTADGDGNPWVTPVFFTPVEHRDVYWVSSPDSSHSRNIAARPSVRLVVFDSTVAVGHGEAVYMAAHVELVPDAEIETCARVFSQRLPESRQFGVEDLTGGADLRLYRARVTEHSVLIRGSDPTYGRGVDSRLVVEL